MRLKMAKNEELEEFDDEESGSSLEDDDIDELDLDDALGD